MRIVALVYLISIAACTPYRPYTRAQCDTMHAAGESIEPCLRIGYLPTH